METEANSPLTAVAPKRLPAVARLVLTIAGTFAVAVLLYRLSLYIRGPDYALGRPWVASSKMYECRPEDRIAPGSRSISARRSRFPT
jgi:hypothetical protein